MAEVWPDRLRAKAGAMLQSAAAFGYFFAALITRIVDVASWRYVYLVGAVPAIFVLFIRLMIKEPERWIEVRDRRKLANAEGPHKATDLDAFTLRQLLAPSFAATLSSLRHSRLLCCLHCGAQRCGYRRLSVRSVRARGSEAPIRTGTRRTQ